MIKTQFGQIANLQDSVLQEWYMVGQMLEETSENSTFLFEVIDLKQPESKNKLVAKISVESENIVKEVSIL